MTLATDAARVLDRAAERIEEKGWFGSSKRDPGNRECAFIALSHAFIELEALGVVDIESGTLAFQAVTEEIGGTNLIGWNDRQTNRRPVIRTLRRVARNLRSRAGEETEVD